MAYMEKVLYDVLGTLLEQARINSGLTLTEVADKMGVTPMTIQRYEKGQRKINVESIKQLCKIYGFDSSNFMSQAARIAYYASAINEESKSDVQNDLSDDEIEILKDYRSLDAPGKEAVRATIQSQIKRIDDYGDVLDQINKIREEYGTPELKKVNTK